MADIPQADWDRLASGKGPCMTHCFLGLLERTGCVGEGTGWLPTHLMLRDEAGAVVAVMPLYAKEHSWGEYVFDWSWANAWQQLGLNYYPKLVSAVPMTPVRGSRFCVSPQVPLAEAMACALQAVRELAGRQGASGWHLLFLADEEAQAWSAAGLTLRTGCHFHWHNRGYGSFDDYLAGFTARARKAVRRERRRVGEQGLRLERIPGSAAKEQHWWHMYCFYRQTCSVRGHPGYLNEEFFLRLGEEMAENTLLILARGPDGSEDWAGGALCFYDHDNLYGRYWGALRDYDCLHFETCYYQGIEFCIEQGLHRFDPGAQGEHKIRRGFEPVLIRSAHWVSEQRLTSAVQDFCKREDAALRAYGEQCRRALPFRSADGDATAL